MAAEGRGSSGLRQRVRRSLVPAARVLAAILVAMLTGACAASANAIATPGTSAASSVAAGGILGEPVTDTPFDAVTAAIDRLYVRHPDVGGYVVQGVTYTAATRDKVLKICHEGGLVSTEKERETQEVLACAPLIFFFYRYGQTAGGADSTDVARLLYQYTVSSHSAESKEVLTELLRSWGVD